MKKILSFALVCVMLMSAMVIPTSAAQSNMSVEALAFAAAPTLDGSISAEEWGEPTVYVKGSEAATLKDTVYNALNTFIWEEVEGSGIETHNFKLWLRWDKDRYYIGTQIEDPDGYQLKSGNANIWDGDCFQFRIDPKGPNAAQALAEDGYDYTTTPFDAEKYEKPWSANTILNVGCGAQNSKTVKPSVYDMDGGYREMTKTTTYPDGTNASMGIVKASADNGFVTTLEISIPWHFIFGKDTPVVIGEDNVSKQYGIGKVLGMSAVVLNASASNTQNSYNGWLTWGSGICGSQYASTPKVYGTETENTWKGTNGGSNAVTLSAKDAITGEDVAGLPYFDSVPAPVEYKDQVFLAPFGTNYGQYYCYVNPDGYVSQYEAAMIDYNPQNPERTYIGFVFGNAYSCFAGWDYTTKTFVIAKNTWASAPLENFYAQSQEQFDWQMAVEADEEAGTPAIPAEWHRLTLKSVGNYVALYCDGKLVVEDTGVEYDEANPDQGRVYKRVTDDDLAKVESIFYQSGKSVYDNLIIANTDYDIENNKGETIINYSLDTTDTPWTKSELARKFSELNLEIGEYKPNNAEDDNGFFYAEKLAKSSAMLGDSNGDGKVNTTDVIMILRNIAGWDLAKFDTAAADVNGDGNINATDAVIVLRYLAGWELSFNIGK